MGITRKSILVLFPSAASRPNPTKIPELTACSTHHPSNTSLDEVEDFHRAPELRHHAESELNCPFGDSNTDNAMERVSAEKIRLFFNGWETW